MAGGDSPEIGATVTAAGLATNYIKAGSGEPVVLGPLPVPPPLRGRVGVGVLSPLRGAAYFVPYSRSPASPRPGRM